MYNLHSQNNSWNSQNNLMVTIVHTYHTSMSSLSLSSHKIAFRCIIFMGGCLLERGANKHLQHTKGELRNRVFIGRVLNEIITVFAAI